MAFFDNGMTRYVAPEGMVYDWKIPHTGTIIKPDGTEEEITEHLYARYLQISNWDSIDNYIAVPDPRFKKAEAK